MSAADDEGAIRALVADWLAASRSGDVDAVLALMADDAVFLVPGHAPMRKADFAAAARAQSAPGAPRFDGESEIQELRVLGDWAFLWAQLRVTLTFADGAVQVRAGHTLTVLQKVDGRWKLARDANLMAVEPPVPAR